jgi:hypothetical protein
MAVYKLQDCVVSYEIERMIVCVELEKVGREDVVVIHFEVLADQSLGSTTQTCDKHSLWFGQGNSRMLVRYITTVC